MLITPEHAFEQHLNHIYLTTEGTVTEILLDDLTGVKHQRFLIHTKVGHSLLIVYNIQNNIRLDVEVGDTVQISGTYVWNRYGGIIHETHSEINKDQPDGNIKIIKGNK